MDRAADPLASGLVWVLWGLHPLKNLPHTPDILVDVRWRCWSCNAINITMGRKPIDIRLKYGKGIIIVGHNRVYNI